MSFFFTARRVVPELFLIVGSRQHLIPPSPNLLAYDLRPARTTPFAHPNKPAIM